MNQIFVIPKKDVRVVDPTTQKPLPAEGALVDESTYWLRRLNDGDVTIGKAPAAKPTSK